MADNADITDAVSETTYRANLYNSRREEPQAAATGQCLYCGEPVGPGRRWCDANCRDDWQAENE